VLIECFGILHDCSLQSLLCVQDSGEDFDFFCRLLGNSLLNIGIDSKYFISVQHLKEKL
jgi:hypothetical protein